MHYFFEEDLVPQSVEQNDARAAVRKALYVEMYGRPSYDWITPSDVGEGSSSSGQRYDTPPPDPSMISTTKPVKKPYIPPTDVSLESNTPFGDKIDPPMS